MLQLRTLVPIRRVLDRRLRKIEGPPQLVQLVGSRVAQRYPHEPRSLPGQPAGIAELRRLAVTDASQVDSAIDDHAETILPVRPTAIIITDPATPHWVVARSTQPGGKPRACMNWIWVANV